MIFSDRKMTFPGQELQEAKQPLQLIMVEVLE